MSLKRTKSYQSFSSEETKKLGRSIARALNKKKRSPKGAVVFALEGDLGAGKTTFVQGFFSGLGTRKRPASPTFIIMRRQGLKKGKFKNVFHIDAYRLKKPAHLEALGFREATASPENIILIEWADRVRSLLPKTTHWIHFKHGAKENKRTIVMRALTR